MILIKVIVGILLLAFGKKLVWMFVGLVGFVSGLTIAQTIAPNIPLWYSLAAGAVAALLLVLIAKFVKNIAFGLGGFLLGAYLVNGLLTLLKLELGTLAWILILMGGALGAFFMLAAFDWALKILSSFAGAMLITQTLPTDFPFSHVVFIGLVVLGVILQTTLRKRIKTEAS